MSRTDALKALVAVEMPISEAISRMSKFEWDSEEHLAVLAPEHLERALSLFTVGALSASDVEAWANALECRDDLALSAPVVSEVLFELANPAITYPFSSERVVQLLSVLKHVG